MSENEKLGIGKRVRIIGDHPHRGALGTVIDDPKLVLDRVMFEIELDRQELGAITCFAHRDNLRTWTR